jgi:hypothetical protein
MAHGHVHRTAASIVRAFVSKHSTFATFLSEPLDGLQRWQSACLWRIAHRSSRLVGLGGCCHHQTIRVPADARTRAQCS